MATHNATGVDESHKKRRRSNKPDEGPARQRRKVSDVNPGLGKTNAESTIEGDTDMTQNGAEALAVQTTDGPRRKRRHSKRRSDAALTPALQKALKSEAGRWHFQSERVGGRYLCHDPVFSVEGRTLFGATGSTIRVLSVEDSVQENILNWPENGAVTAYALSAIDPSRLYVAYAQASGLLQWNWSTTAPGSHLYTDLEGISSIALGSRTDNEEDLVWTAHQTTTGSFIALNGEKVFTPKDQALDIQNISADGTIMLASVGSTIVLGIATQQEATLQTTFVEFQTSAEITCLAARQVVAAGKKGRQPRQSLSLAVGNAGGEIFLYQDISLSGSSSGLPTPRTLHWHRDAVGSVKWSRDGNYLVSGGRETVLVLWQLETGRKQFLPHLSAEVESITVSPDGTKYAIQLADNSIMVLSTSELVPIANFAGIQAIVNVPSTPAATKTKNQETVAELPTLFSSTATLHPTRKNELLAAVASSTPMHHSEQQSSRPRPFLQTFDLDSERHIARQALSRNKLTDFTTGPEGNSIQEPNVTFLSISQDGDWLATVEEWSPPAQDTSYLAANNSINTEHVKLRTEIYLKFWHWNTQKSVWALDTRIDNPHPAGLDDRPGHVLALASDPAETGFATVGEDSTVRIWRPQTRRRNGIVAKGEHNTEWKARRVIALDAASDPDEPIDLDAAMAYSTDGSLLSVSLAPRLSSSPSPIEFIHVPTGELLEPQCGIYTGHLVDLAFVHRNLIILSTASVTVWDVVTASLTHRTKLDDAKNMAHPFSSRPRILASNPVESRFAVAVPVDMPKPAGSAATAGNSATAAAAATRVVVYSPCAPFQRVFDEVLADVVTAVLCGPERGFKLLLASGEVVTLEEKAALPVVVHAEAIIDDAEQGPEEIEAQDDIDDDDDDNGEAFNGLDEDGEEPFRTVMDEGARLVRAEQLARILDAPDALNMPVSAMFDAVVGLFARKVVM